MLLPAFHPSGWDYPDSVLNINFAPQSTDHFPGPASGQYCQLERKSCDTVLSAKNRNELTDDVVRERGMMAYRTQNGFDPSTQSHGGLSFRSPDGLNDPRHHPRVNILHRHGT
jgi:hypothetical protein